MIRSINIRDKRYPLKGSAGSDAIHTDPVYSYAVTVLIDDSGHQGVGLAFTVGNGNELVCQAAAYYAKQLIGKDIETLMADFGLFFKQLADDQQYRWLGPHKGVVHLALASVTNACFDLWAKKRQLPLWKLLNSLNASEVAALLDLSYLEDVLDKNEVLQVLQDQGTGKLDRETILQTGYPGYDTSVGWFNYTDEQIRENCHKAIANGFTALKLKVGSADPERDIRRAKLVREVAGDAVTIMLDANQQWTLPQALSICEQLREMDPFWIEEPTHPDDVLAHQTLAQRVAPLKIAAGEHLPNKILFKNYLQAGALAFAQPDAVRLGGVSEFITVSLLCKKFNIPVVPHVGDMGQLHQHLVLFNHVSLGHQALFLEHIPHLRQHFTHPANIVNGRYQVPQEPGSSCDLIDLNEQMI